MPKILYRQNKRYYIKKAKSVIKNPSAYVFCKFDQIFKKKLFSIFNQKWHFLHFLAKKNPKIIFFLLQNGLPADRNFWPEKKLAKNRPKHIFLSPKNIGHSSQKFRQNMKIRLGGLPPPTTLKGILLKNA